MPSRKKKSSKIRSATRIAKKASSKAARVAKEKAPDLPVDQIRNRLVSYAEELQEYLRSVNANVETFKFGVEKGENGLTIDAAFKATVGA